MAEEKMNGKDAFMAAVTETVDMLPINWDAIDPENPYPVDVPVKPGEEVIGELTDNQKVLWTALSQVTDTLNNQENSTPAVSQYNQIQEMLHNILYTSVGHHFGMYERNVHGSGIKEGHQVVTLPPECDCPGCLLARILSLPPGIAECPA